MRLLKILPKRIVSHISSEQHNATTQHVGLRSHIVRIAGGTRHGCKCGQTPQSISWPGRRCRRVLISWFVRTVILISSERQHLEASNRNENSSSAIRFCCKEPSCCLILVFQPSMLSHEVCVMVVGGRESTVCLSSDSTHGPMFSRCLFGLRFCFVSF